MYQIWLLAHSDGKGYSLPPRISGKDRRTEVEAWVQALVEQGSWAWTVFSLTKSEWYLPTCIEVCERERETEVESEQEREKLRRGQWKLHTSMCNIHVHVVYLVFSSFIPNLVASPSSEFRSAFVSTRWSSFIAISDISAFFLNRDSATDFFLGVLFRTVRGIYVKTICTGKG